MDADEEMVLNLKYILLWFEAASGLQVNSSKTKVYQVNKVEGWEAVEKNWECSIGQLPDTYLGLPLGYKLKAAWQGLLQNLEINSLNGKGNLYPKLDVWSY